MKPIVHRVRRFALRGYPFPKARKPGVPLLVRYNQLYHPAGERAGHVAVFRLKRQAALAHAKGLRRMYKQVRIVPVIITVTTEVAP